MISTSQRFFAQDLQCGVGLHRVSSNASAGTCSAAQLARDAPVCDAEGQAEVVKKELWPVTIGGMSLQPECNLKKPVVVYAWASESTARPEIQGCTCGTKGKNVSAAESLLTVVANRKK